jgi:hypothetical protein
MKGKYDFSFEQLELLQGKDMANYKKKKVAHELDVFDLQGSIFPNNAALLVPIQQWHPILTPLN